jgi:CheY-like chemotaxis protein
MSHESDSNLEESNSLRRVLVVEDDDDVRDLFRELLQLHGHYVVVAKDGREALALLAAERFDIALVDISLPGIDGREVARRARAQLGPRTPMLAAISGHARDTDRDSSRLAGFDVHLSKPVDTSTVLQLVAGSRSLG